MDWDRLTRVAGIVLGRPVRLRDFLVAEVAYSSGSPATGGLWRVGGVTEDGEHWRAFLKRLHHVRHWPRLDMLPAEVRESFAATFPWRMELDAWGPGFAGRLPAGMRVPRLYTVDDLGDDQLDVWMEDVEVLDGAWDVDRFAHAAFLLGGLAALRSEPAATPDRPGLRGYYDGRVRRGAVPALDDDALWTHPLVAAAVDPELRADLRGLAATLDGVMDRLDTLPQALPHGDASPQNLLVPVAAPDTIVAIDISFQAPHAIGFDLGQLLVGLVHAGEFPAADLARIHDVLVPSFAAGLKEYGAEVSTEDITSGYVGCLLVRAGFTSLPFELLGGPLAGSPSDDLAATFRERAALTRFIVDLALSSA